MSALSNKLPAVAAYLALPASPRPVWVRFANDVYSRRSGRHVKLSVKASLAYEHSIGSWPAAPTCEEHVDIMGFLSRRFESPHNYDYVEADEAELDDLEGVVCACGEVHGR